VNQAQRRIGRLKRRADWIEARAAIGDDEGKDNGFDKAELAALRWAIEILEQQFGKTSEPVDEE
jgi:hypothetical protein